jgi:hypothetical protein
MPTPMTSDALDALVLDLISKGTSTAGAIIKMIPNEDLGLKETESKHRLVDRSIQRLRKTNKIKFNGKTWNLVP